jgi:glucoamylase
MLPEQVWDRDDVPARELFNGRPTGSAMPLVWAHAEYAKLVRSLHDGRVFDMPQQPYERYIRQRLGCDITLWTPSIRASTMPVGNRLRVMAPVDCVVRWAANEGAPREKAASDTTIGVWCAELETTLLPVGTKVRFNVGSADGTAWSAEHEVEVVC